MSEEVSDAAKAASKRYAASEKGKAARKRYYDSERGQRTRKLYNTRGDRRYLLQKRYSTSEKGIERYNARKEKEQKMREYARREKLGLCLLCGGDLGESKELVHLECKTESG